MPHPGTKVNRLDTMQLVAAADWFRNNAEIIVEKRPSYQELADLLYEGTGIRMNPKPAVRMANQLGIQWDTSRGRGRSKVKIDLAQVQNDLRLISRIVCMLCEKSEHTFDEGDIDSMMEISTRPRSNGD